MRQKIRLDTITDIHKFVNKVTTINDRVVLKDDVGHCVDAKSLLGSLYAMEWREIYCYCDTDITSTIFPWIV